MEKLQYGKIVICATALLITTLMVQLLSTTIHHYTADISTIHKIKKEHL